jgi:chromosome segregation ATPase
VADLTQLRQDVDDLQSVTTTIIGSDSNKSMREVAAEEVAAIVADAPADLDTLQEIAAWINDHPDSASDLNNRLTIVEGDVSDLQSELAALEAQQIINTGDIADLEDALAALRAKDVDLQSQIDVIDNRLKWQAISDENAEEENPESDGE